MPASAGFLLLANAIAACNKAGKYIGICGQGPSDHPDLAKWLMKRGIDSVSLNPDSVIKRWLFLAGTTVDDQQSLSSQSVIPETA